MSQRERPGCAQSPNSQQRMPFQAAEALLWGRQTHNEHVHLYGRMRELEEQHRDYDARIQASETIAEAAEAATVRVRRVEQQVAAIESDEQDRPFDKWVEGEISSFKNFTESNKNVRQKQIELEEKLSRVEDSTYKFKDGSDNVEMLLERVARLERDHISDANRIRKLETDVTILTLRPSSWPEDVDRLVKQTSRRQAPKQMLPPPSRQPHAEVQDDSETEEENNDLVAPLHSKTSVLVQAQVSCSPEIKAQSSSSVFRLGSSPSKETGGIPATSSRRGVISARTRVMQRKSIHEPKKTQKFESGQSRGPAHGTGSDGPAPPQVVRSRIHADPLPATQIVSNSSAAMAAYAEDIPMPTRDHVSLTKSRAPAARMKPRSRIQAKPPSTKSNVSGSNAAHLTHNDDVTSLASGPEHPKQRIVTLPTRKRKLNDDELSPRLTRSQAKRSQDAVPVEPQIPTTKAVDVKDFTAKRRKYEDSRAEPQARSMAPKPGTAKDYAKVSSNAANLVKTSPRKAAMTTKRQSCNACNKAHKSCDQVRPVCGNCHKRPLHGGCVYTNSHGSQPPPATQKSSSSKTKTTKPSMLPKITSPLNSRGQSGFHCNEHQASSNNLTAGKPTSPVRSSIARKTPKNFGGRSGLQNNETRSSFKTMAVGRQASPTRSSIARKGPYAASKNSTAPMPQLTGPPHSSTRSIMPTFDDYKDSL